MKIKFLTRILHPKTKEGMLTIHDVNGLSYVENVEWDVFGTIQTGYSEDNAGNDILIWKTYASGFEYYIKSTEEE